MCSGGRWWVVCKVIFVSNPSLIRLSWVELMLSWGFDNCVSINEMTANKSFIGYFLTYDNCPSDICQGNFCSGDNLLTLEKCFLKYNVI